MGLDDLALRSIQLPGMNIAHERSIARVVRTECDDAGIRIAIEKAFVAEPGVIRVGLRKTECSPTLVAPQVHRVPDTQ